MAQTTIQTEDREGDRIHMEAGVEVRSYPDDANAHNVWIGEDYYFFARGILKQYAERTLPSDIEKNLANYNQEIPGSLERIGLSACGLALILARVDIKQHEQYEIDLQNELHGDTEE